MPPPAGQGQRGVLATHYARNGDRPVAYVDETYSVQEGQRNFYVMTAVVVTHGDRDPLRKDLDALVPGGWWHTTDELRRTDGRERARLLLQTFQSPEETCVIVDVQAIGAADADGEAARASVLGRLFEALHSPTGGSHEPVGLVIMEERRDRKQNHCDRKTRADLVQAKRIPASLELVHASPGTDHLLWLPDLACSAYRQKMLYGHGDLYSEIAAMTTVIELDTANPRLP